SSEPALLTNVNGTLFFTADDGATGRELWKSDGTVAGTVLVKDILPQGQFTDGSFPQSLTDVNGTLFFSANDGVSGGELWKSDGTAAGSLQVPNIFSSAATSEPAFLTDVNGTLFFTADDGATGTELWKSDGTATGTALVKDLRPGPASSPLAWFTNVNG